jgi:microcystin-dependent protein
LPQAAFSPGTTISSSAVNSDFSDIAAALTGSVAADGQTPITSPFHFLDGTVSTPAITFTSDSGAGLYHPATDQVALAAGGNGLILQAPSAAAGAGLITAAGVIIAPIGIIQDFAGSTAPAGWFLCYGQAISRTTYAELFAVISTTFGTGDGSTTFNVPDLRGRSSSGKDNMGGSAAGRITTTSGVTGTTLGSAGGEQTHTLVAAEAAVLTYGASVTDPGHHHTSGPAANSVASGTANVAAGGQGLLTPVAMNTINTGDAVTGISVTPTSNAGGGAHNNLQPTIILNKIIFAGRT